MWGIFGIIFSCFCYAMANALYKNNKKEKGKSRIEEEGSTKRQKEDKIRNLKNELKNIDAEMNPILHSVKSKNRARIEELEKNRNRICVELYELTGERTLYKGLIRSSWGPNPLEMEYTKIDIRRSKEKQKQEEKERLIQQQIQEKQIKKAASWAPYLVGWAIGNAINNDMERSRREKKQEQQEKELKEMKELLKKLNKK